MLYILKCVVTCYYYIRKQQYVFIYLYLFIVPYEDVVISSQHFYPYLADKVKIKVLIILFYYILQDGKDVDFYIEYRDKLLSIISYIFSNIQLYHLFDLSNCYLYIHKVIIIDDYGDDDITIEKCILFWCEELKNGLINSILFSMFKSYLNVYIIDLY